MADNKIRLSISSVFDGKGMAQATKAVKDVGNSVKQASSSVASIAGEFGQLNGTVGKVAGSVQNLFASFAGGPLGVAIAAITTIISLLSKWKNSMDENREAHRKMYEDMSNGYRNRLQKSIEGAERVAAEFLDKQIEKGKQALENIRAMASAYESLAASERKAAAALDSIKLAEIDSDTQRRLRNATSEEDKKIILAEAGQKKAQLQNQSDLRNAQGGVDDAQRRLDATRKELVKLNSVIANMEEAGKDTTKELQQMKQLRMVESKQMNELAAANNTLKTAQIKAATAAEKAAQDIADAEKSKAGKIEDDENQAYERRMLSMQADWNQQEADAKEKIDNAEKERIEKEKKAVEAKKKNLEEEREQARKLGEKQLEALQQKADAEKKLQQKGMNSDAAHHNGLFGQYKYSTDENGNINSFKDWQRARRYAGRADRDADRNDPAAQRFSRLSREIQRGRKLSGKDAEFMKEYKEYKDSLKAPEKIRVLAERIKVKLEDIDKKIKGLQ